VEEKKPEEKKLSPFTLIGGAAASVTWMIAGSFFGAAGTIYGVALGSVTTTAGAYYYETAARKAHARLIARKEQAHADAHPQTHPVQAQLSANLLPAREKRALLQWTMKKKLAFAGGMLALCMASAVASLLIIESATGQTLHSDLTGQRQYGNSFSYSTQKPSAAPGTSVTPGVTPGSGSASPSISASSSPSPSTTPDPAPTVTPSEIYTGVSQ
jgi:hypothetical protein